MKINSNEAIRLFVILIISKIFFWDITKLVYRSGTAAWMNAVISTVLALAAFCLVYFAYKKTNYDDVFDTVKYVSGKTGLVIFGVLFAVIQIINFVIVLKAYCNTITTITLTSSSRSFVLAFIVATIIASGYMGIKSVTKLASASFFVIILFLVAMIVFDIPNFDLKNVLPIFGNGIYGIAQSYKSTSFFNEIIFLFFLVPFLKDKKSVGKIGFLSILFSGIIISVITLVFTLIVPYPANTQYYLPVFEITSTVDFFVIFQRAESIFLLLWIFTCFLYMGAAFCFILQTLKKTFSLSDEKAVIPAVLMIIITLMPLYDNINAIDPVHDVISYVFLITLFAVMTVFFAISAYRRKRAK